MKQNPSKYLERVKSYGVAYYPEIVHKNLRQHLSGESVFSFQWHQKGTYGTSLAVQWLRHLASTAGGEGSIPGRGAKIPHASWPKNQNIKKQKQYCNKFNKDFKNGPHQKNL